MVIDYNEEVIIDQLICGIGDKEILSDLFEMVQTDMTLQEIMDYIPRKEQAKIGQGTVSCEQTNLVQQTPTKLSTCCACQH